jgi:hypothetical protein
VRRLRTELDAARSFAAAPPPREVHPPLIVPPAA